MRVQTRYRQVAEEFARRLVEQFPEVQAVVLYGSVARGEAHEDSDIDLLVLTDGEAKTLQECARSLALKIEDEFRESRAFIQAMVENVSEFGSRAEMGYPWERTIARKGVPLFDRGAFAVVHVSLSRIREEQAPYRPSPQTIGEYLQSAEQALAAAKLLLERGFWNDASNRAYYAMFNAASAAVLTAGIEEIRSHKALVGLFREKVALGKKLGRSYADDLQQAFQLRLDADYTPGFHVGERTAREVLAKAGAFVAQVREFVAPNLQPGP